MEVRRTAHRHAAKLTLPNRVRATSSRGLGALLVASCLLACNGCTIVGAVVGSSIPKRDPLPETPIANRASQGQDIDVEARQRAALSGTYGGEYDEKLWVKNEDATAGVAEPDVKHAEVHHDNYFMEGLFAGLAVDATIIAILGATATSWLPKTESAYHAGADGVSVAGR